VNRDGEKNKSGMSNLFNELSEGREFNEVDVVYFLVDKIKSQVDATSVSLLLDRVLLRQKNGRFSKNDLYEWLMGW
jgi:hypothetical protein